MRGFFKKIILISLLCLLGIIINLNIFFFKDKGTENESFFVRAASLVDTFVSIILVCGDGFTDSVFEFCDPGNPDENIPPDVGTTTCQDFIEPISSQPFESGDLTCRSDCTYYSTSTCYTCGNNYMKVPMEECDGTDFGGNDCITFGYTGGNLLCTSECYLDLSECYTSGTEEPEEGDTNTTGGASGGTSGYFPGQEEKPRETTVIIKGKSYPHSEVRVLIDGKVVGIVKADSKADFRFEMGDVTPGVRTFGLWSEDERGLKSTLLTLTFRVASKSITTISNVYISPTIDVDKRKVKKGNDIKIFGKSSPEVGIHIHIQSEEIIEKTTSNTRGDWSFNFNTAVLEEDFHTVKAIIRLEAPEGIIESNFSHTVSFYVGEEVIEEEECGIADLNCDGFVNLVDFSILLYNWGTDDDNADINDDGIVGLPDFSIMMYYWTG